MTSQEGPPDERRHEHYGVYNEYNLIDLRSPTFQSRTYRANLVIDFTFNKGKSWREWREEVTRASIRWMAKTTGDVLLDWDLLPIIGRSADGRLVVNDFSREREDEHVNHANEPEYQALIDEMLRIEGLDFERAPLVSIDPAWVPDNDV